MTSPEAFDVIKIAVIENAIEAQLLTSLLQQFGIPHHLHSYHDTAYDGLFQLQRGWGEVRGPRQRQSQILEILADIRRAVPHRRDEDPGDHDLTP